MNRQRGIALDAMGGDHAPVEVVRGAFEYVRDTGDKVILIGPPDALRQAIDEVGATGAGLTIHPASQVIEFGEKISSIRTKRDSSIHVGCRLVRDGLASGFVSGGHTGAVMALSKVIFGLIEGVDRPALPAALPRRDSGYTILIDAGANLECRPEHFRQFSVMGFHYARRVFGVENPKVALLSVGEEDTKGSTVTQEVSTILRETRVNFIGNVEGNHLFTNRADVVLCDGFVGNVTLKVCEGLAETVVHHLKDGVRGGLGSKIGGMLLKPVFRALTKKMDWAEYGGVPLLGVKQVVVVAHGRSTAKAIGNALRVAATATRSEMVAKIARDISVLHETEQRVAARHSVAK